MNIYRSFVTIIWNQVMSLLSVKLTGTHLVSCTVMATWHRVLHKKLQVVFLLIKEKILIVLNKCLLYNKDTNDYFLLGEKNDNF